MDIESNEITLYNLQKFYLGEYNSYLLFTVNGPNYGDKINLKLVVKEKENPKRNPDEDWEKIKEFRKNFGLDENDFPDEKILEILKYHNFNYEKAFESLF